MEGPYATPIVTAGLKGLRLLKTTKSAFVNFVQDGYRSLPDAQDRICSTIVEAHWNYRSLNNLNFCQAFDEVVKALIDNFAGPSSTGIFSPSVQKTLYDAQVHATVIMRHLETQPNIGTFSGPISTENSTNERDLYGHA